jgi:hypothetical protein
MLDMIKGWLGTEKGLINGVVQGRVTPDVVRQLEKLFRSYNVPGNLRVVNHTLAQFVLEGPKSKLNRVLTDLPQSPAVAGQVVKIAWGEYKGRHQTFRVTL